MTLAKMFGLLAGFVGARFVGAALGFLSQVLLARMLPQADVGVVLLAMSVAAFVSLVSIGGYALMAMTQLPKLATHGRASLLRAFHKSALSDGTVMVLAGSAILIAASHILNLSEGQKTAVLFGCLCAPAASLIRYNGTAATTDRQFKLAYVPDFVVRPLLFLAFLVFVLVLAIKIGTAITLWTYLLIGVLVAVTQSMLLGKTGVLPSDFGWPRKALASKLRSRAFALTVVAAASFAFADILTIIAGMLLPEADLAVVGITVRLAAVAGFVLQGGQMFVLPDVTQSLVRREQKTVHQLLTRMHLLTFSIIASGLLVVLLFGQQILGIFGEEYKRGSFLLLLMILGQAVRAFGGMNQHILSINGHQRRTAGACVVTLLVLVSLSIILVRAMGIIGIGYATLVAELTWVVALAAQAQKLCTWRGDPLWLWQNRN